MVAANNATNIVFSENGAIVRTVKNATFASKATKILADDAADRIVSADCTIVRTIGHSTLVIASDAADIRVSAEVAIFHADILDHSTVNITKQTYIIHTAVVEIQAADGVAVAVKGTGIGSAFATHGNPDAEIASGDIGFSILS